MIRTLALPEDREAIWHLMLDSADYIWMEREEPPLPYLVDELFTDAPPGLSATDGYRAGLFEGERLLALADLSFGFPDKGDSYLGLMIVPTAARGTEAGKRLLRHLEEVARSKGAAAMYLAVLDVNPRGRAFWQREGFAPTGAHGTVTLGQKTQTVQRLGKPL